MNKYKQLKELLNSPETLVVPDAYDGISARLIEYAGFKAVQCSGYSYSISKKIGNENLLTLDENLSRTGEIVSAVNLPVMADGEDGYGVKEIFGNNILKFIKTGIAGINIEDQNLWNSYAPEKIVSMEVMGDKIREIISIKRELRIDDFIINARTDALRSNEDRKKAMDEAIRRSNAFHELGADLAFITYVKTLEEVKLLRKEIKGPISIAAGLPYNIEEFSIKDCMEIGVNRVSLPSILIFGAIKSLQGILGEIRETGEFKNIIEGEKLIETEILGKLLK